MDNGRNAWGASINHKPYAISHQPLAMTSISRVSGSPRVVAKMLGLVPRGGVMNDPNAASRCRDDLDQRRSAEADRQDRGHDFRRGISNRFADGPRPEANAEHDGEDHGRDEQA